MPVSGYLIRTAQTAKLSPFVPFGAYSEETPDFSPYTLGGVSNVTAIISQTTVRAFRDETALEAVIPDLYPSALASQFPAKQAGVASLLKVPHHGQRELGAKVMSYHPAGSVSAVTLNSTATEPQANTVQPFLSAVDQTTASTANLVTFVGVWLKAQEWFTKARVAARADDLRTAYHGVYRGVDLLPS